MECQGTNGPSVKGKVGTTILSAAIIDDVIGIIVLTFVIGFKNPDTDPMGVVVSTLLFFLAAVGVGFILYLVFQKLDQRYPHTRRIPILGLALCFAFAYGAEKWFGIADITGAYVAGIILCSIQDSQYIDEKIDINSYMYYHKEINSANADRFKKYQDKLSNTSVRHTGKSAIFHRIVMKDKHHAGRNNP